MPGSPTACADHAAAACLTWPIAAATARKRVAELEDENRRQRAALRSRMEEAVHAQHEALQAQRQLKKLSVQVRGLANACICTANPWQTCTWVSAVASGPMCLIASEARFLFMLPMLVGAQSGHDQHAAHLQRD